MVTVKENKMNRVKFDPKLSTLDAAGHTTPAGMTQTQLDDIIRRESAPNAVEKLIIDTLTNQEYKLSNGQFLIISKRSGKGRIERTFGGLVRRF